MSGNLYRLPIMIVALVIGIIMVTAVILPLSSEYSEAKTFTNTGYFYMDKITSDDTDEIVIEWDVSDSKIMTVNDKDIDITTLGFDAYQHATIFCTGTDLFRLGYTNDSQGLSWIQIRGSTIAYAGASSYFKATISAGTVSINIDSEASPRTLSYTEAYVINAEKADYVMKKSNETAYLLDDSTIYGMGTTSVANGTQTPDTVIFLIDGDVESVTVTDVYSTGSVTVSDIEINKTAVNGYIDLYDFSKVTFTATESATDTAVTYSYLIVPSEVSADPDNPAAYKSLVMVIPLMAFVVLVVAAAAMIYYKKD